MSESVSLKEYFERILEEKDKAVNIALAAAKEAVGVAEKNAEKWRENANEWRGAMSDRERNFMSRTEFVAFKENTEKTLNMSAGRGQGVHALWLFVLGAVALIGTSLGIINALK